MNQRDFLLTKINSGKAELEQMPAFMQMEREYLQADIKECEEELAKIPPGPNGEKIYFLNRQINAAKDYLHRLHPRFEEERKQREEFIQEKEAELMKLEKENGAKTPQLEPCPFCGSMPVEYNSCIRCEAPDCYVQPGIKSEMPEFLPKLWNQMAMIEEANETGNPVKAESGKIESDKTQEVRRDEPISFFEVNPCAKCGYDPQTVESGEMVTIYCPRCTRVSQFKERNKAIEFWNQQNPLKEESSESDSDNPFKPCAKCGSPVEWEVAFSGRNEGFIKCPRCGNGITFNNGDFSSIDEVVGKWNQVNKPDENQEQSNDSKRIFPDKYSQMLLIKLELLNSILGLQRDAVGPVIEVKEIQETLVEIVKAIHDGVKWDKPEPIKKLAGETEKMEKDPYLIPSEKKNIPIRGSVYVTELHIARAVCQEAEMLVWKYEQKNGIEGMTAIPEYLYQLSEWLFVRAEYLRETEECF